MELDGREKADLQRTLGTRNTVEELDRLRLTFGFDAVEILTPFVESKLRSGQIPQRCLKIATVINNGTLSFSNGLKVSVEITFQLRFPSVPVAAEILLVQSGTAIELDETIVNGFKQKVKEFVGEDTSAEIVYPVEIINYCMAEVKCLDELYRVETEVTETEEDLSTNVDIAPIGQPTAIVNSVFQLSMNEYDKNSIFCCKKCGTELFDASMLGSHSDPDQTKYSCSSYFLEDPPEWLDQNKVDCDKMYCKKCATRVGSWCWSGSRCGCKAWIVPSFQVIKSKVDPKQRML